MSSIVGWFICLCVFAVQECFPCDPVCNGCSGPSSGHCIQCTGYQEDDDCVKSCSLDYYADELTKECKLCDEQCEGCRGPTAADCYYCLHIKLYDNVEDHTADTPVCDTNHCFDIGRREHICHIVHMLPILLQFFITVLTIGHTHRHQAIFR